MQGKTLEQVRSTQCRNTTCKDNNTRALLTTLKQCSKRGDLKGGERIHAAAVGTGYHTNIYVATALITMYSKCRSMSRARNVFNSMLHRDIVSWNALIMGYVDNGESSVAMELFTNICCEPSHVTFVAAIKACIQLFSDKQSDKHSCLEKGIGVHMQAEKLGFDAVICVANTLVFMYRKMGIMLRARDVFDRMIHRDVVSWTNLILGYVENGESLVALELFRRMECVPDPVTFVAVLKAWASLAAEKLQERQFCLENVMTIHTQIKERDFDTDVYVTSTLLDVYSKCGSMVLAREVFDKMVYRNAVSWTNLINGYVENGQSLVAIGLFDIMDCEPDEFTLNAILKAYGNLARKMDKQVYLQKVLDIHTLVKERGYDRDVFVTSTLVEVYSKCSIMYHAQGVFERTPHRNVVLWSNLILGYVENGQSLVAMNLYMTMDCAPDSFTLAAVLKACACLTELSYGRRIHAQVCVFGWEQTQLLASLIEFYSKCGNVVCAEHVFSGMCCIDVGAWNALIAGYSSAGDAYRVFSLVKTMQETGLNMNSITFVLVLTACSQAGMVERGKRYFEYMSEYGVIPSVEHYTCLVDMLGRDNKLQEALEVIISMPFVADSYIWTSLLEACRRWGNLMIGKLVFDELTRNGEHGHAYVLMGDIYKKLGMQQEWEKLNAV